MKRMAGEPAAQAMESVSGLRAWLLPVGLAALGGAGIGLVGAVFRGALVQAEAWRVASVQALGSQPIWGLIFSCGLAVLGAVLARILIRWVPLAAGSGVQHVEALMRGEAAPGSWLVVPVKFFGGLLAIGGGLALGREGPTIQMGSVIGSSLARWARLPVETLRDLQAALGGAGLGVAFNAPLGGALFVFEEVAKEFRLRLVVITLVGVGLALWVSRSLLGSAPDFAVAGLPESAGGVPLVALGFGLLCGALGTLYNRTTLFFLELSDRLGRIPPEVRAAAIGLLVGLIGWLDPVWIGGGETLNQSLFGPPPALTLLLGLLLVRWLIGPLSYAAGTPGGIFSPLLLVGAILGLVVGSFWNSLVPEFWQMPPGAWAILGMSAFFTGIVRAPLTGLILIAEMTGTYSLLVPMALAGASATLAATWLKNPPIYDSLRLRLLFTLGKKK